MNAFPLWVYILVAAMIAGLAFVIGQLVPGMGVTFAAGTSLAWVAYNISRFGKVDRHG